MHFLLVSTLAATERLPYRSVEPASGMLLKALLITALLLAIALGLLLLAKRAGWLPTGTKPSTPEGIEVISSRRITAATTVVVLRHAGREYLLAESSRNVTLKAAAGTARDAAE